MSAEAQPEASYKNNTAYYELKSILYSNVPNFYLLSFSVPGFHPGYSTSFIVVMTP